MLIHVFETPGLSIFTYLIGDETTNHALIVDPTRDVDQYMMYAKNAGLTITDIAETHVHADFVSGSKELKHRLLGKPTIHCSSLGGPNWTPKYTDTMVQNGSEIKLGNVRLQALHTPGHTPEHIIWLCYDESRNKETPCLALTGDLLFVGGIGRPDLLGEEAKGVLGRQLYDSLFNHMFQFPDFLEIFPAHGGGSLCGKSLSNRSSTTLGYEKLFNPLFNKQPMDKWLEELNRDVPASPKNFQHLKRINVEGPPLLSEVNPSHDEPSFIIDVRNPDIFAKGHIKDSVNIPLFLSFCNWVGMAIAEEMPLGVIGETRNQIEKAVQSLHLIGFDNVVMKEVWDEKVLGAKYSLSKLSTINVEELANKMKDSTQKAYIVDVRGPAEWNDNHIQEAHHLELGWILEGAHEIPKDASVFVLCNTGTRSSFGASLLMKLNHQNVTKVEGGMTAWNQAKYPVITHNMH